MLNPHIPTQNLKKQKKTHDNPWRFAPQLEFPSHKLPKKKKNTNKFLNINNITIRKAS